ncbi:MAG: S1C family serine protease [Planctomycetota bacterium]
MSVRTSPRWVLLGVVSIVALVACLGRNPDPRAAARAREPEGFDLQPEERRIVDIFREASPSVVFISTSVLVRRGFFSRNVEEMPYGAGSGFVWDKQGHVVTNYHVVKDYFERPGVTLTVHLGDGTSYRVEAVVGVARDKEIAVLRIAAPAESLHPIRLGTSSDLQVGQLTLAIGNPFGLDRTLTVGVVSALNREIRALTGRRISGVIQTDAAINPGNSGGPLLNSAGQLIGMNTAILSPSGAYAGIGFAIPGDTVRRYVEQLIKYRGKIRGAGLGVSLFPDAAQRLGLKGILVHEVFAGSAADKAGMRGTRFYEDDTLAQLGDVIVAVDGQRVVDLDGLRDALEKHEVGDKVDVTVLRDGKERKLTVTLQEIELPAGAD